MSHHHHYQSLLQQFVSGLFESIGRTQPPHITHTYRSYVTDTPFAFFAYTATAGYFAYRTYQAYSDRKYRTSMLSGKATQEEKQHALQEGYTGGSSTYYSGNAKQSTSSQAEDSKQFHIRQKQNDQWAIALGTLSVVTALNWSIAPIIQVPQYYAILSCLGAEWAYYSCGANYESRQKCNFRNIKEHGKNDNPIIKFAKCILAVPFVNSIATTVGVDSYITK